MINLLSGEDEHWAPVSDLMAALMLIFVFIAVFYVQNVVIQKGDIEEQKKALQQQVEASEQQKKRYQKMCADIRSDLIEMRDEFNRLFKGWEISLVEDLLSIKFGNSKISFPSGESDIEKFKPVLDEFFPRYMSVLAGRLEDIAEIRIEGHTSSKFVGAESTDGKYIGNMKLSQDRTRKILEYLLKIMDGNPLKEKIKDRITANGLSSSKIIIQNGVESEEASRRVEFRLVAFSCQNEEKLKRGSYDKN